MSSQMSLRRCLAVGRLSGTGLARVRQLLVGVLLLTPVLLLSACSERKESPVNAQEDPFEPVMSHHQLMEWVLEPAVDVIWDSAGTIITAEGRQELAPTTDEGWAEVERAAATLAEGANLLMLPGRAAGADWVEYSRALVATAQQAQQAARKQDADALFDAGGRIYQVCRACHNQYWVREDE